jgi:hypothetical protein
MPSISIASHGSRSVIAISGRPAGSPTMRRTSQRLGSKKSGSLFQEREQPGDDLVDDGRGDSLHEDGAAALQVEHAALIGWAGRKNRYRVLA